MLRRRGIKVTSIAEHADYSPTGKLLEAIIESVDEFYSENLGFGRLTSSLLDRLTHHVHILEKNGESYRLKQSSQVAILATPDPQIPSSH